MGELYRLDFPNGKSYIGISRVSAARRYTQHAADARGQKSLRPLQQAWRKYGAPTLVVLAVLEAAELPEAEIRAIEAFGTLRPDGYNISLGGQLGAMDDPEVAAKVAAALTGRKLSADHRTKLSAAHKGVKQSAATIAKRAATLVGRTVSPETRAKISESNKRSAASPSAKRIAGCKAQAEKIRGRKHSDAHRAAIAEGNRGRVFTAETRGKISAAQTGRRFSEERCANLSLAMRNLARPEEKSRKISEALKGRKQSPEAIEARRRGMQNMTPEKRAAWLARLAARKPSAETRAKLSTAAKADWARRRLDKQQLRSTTDQFACAKAG